ncbi:hypothetical protein VTP01DRAFT_2020 [Rhizomucor pusillus]|uniref:uncharacterized protein n=1 Tax=Rhizomucor pusillus TaxID=4840 RepID=UPI00374433E4
MRHLSTYKRHFATEDIFAKRGSKFTTIEDLVENGDLKEARAAAEKAEKKTSINTASDVYAMYAYYLEQLEVNSYIFEDDVNVTETDFIVKIWARANQQGQSLSAGRIEVYPGPNRCITSCKQNSRWPRLANFCSTYTHYDSLLTDCTWRHKKYLQHCLLKKATFRISEQFIDILLKFKCTSECNSGNC